MTKKSPGDPIEELPAFLNTAPFHKRQASLGRLSALVLAVAVLGIFWGASPLMARKKKPPTTKTVQGQVLDPSDNGITGAAVEMTDLTTGKKSAIYAETGGNYIFTGLKTTHDYQFRATYKGKSSETRKVSSWDMRMRLVINLHIPPPKD